jgi:two-component sensor histidine kinase
LLDCQAAEVYLYRPEQDALALAARYPDGEMPAILMRRGEGLAGRVLEAGHMLQIDDYQNWEGHFAAYAGLPIGAVLSAPVVWAGEMLGVLSAGRSAVRPFEAEERRGLEMLAAHAAVAIHNAQAMEQIRRDAVHKTTLLQEVNHRVKNNLMAIKGLLQAEQRYTPASDRTAVAMAMERLNQRIDSLSEVHELLSQSQWAPVRLSELVERVFAAARPALQEGQSALLDNPPSPVQVSPRQAGNLALVINELVTNTFKYAFGERPVVQVAVCIGVECPGAEVAEENDAQNTGRSHICLEYRDDGPGYPENVLRLEKYDVGLYLIQRLVRHTLDGSVQLSNQGGAVTRLYFAAEDVTRT